MGNFLWRKLPRVGVVRFGIRIDGDTHGTTCDNPILRVAKCMPDDAYKAEDGCARRGSAACVRRLCVLEGSTYPLPRLTKLGMPIFGQHTNNTEHRLASYNLRPWPLPTRSDQCVDHRGKMNSPLLPGPDTEGGNHVKPEPCWLDQMPR